MPSHILRHAAKFLPPGLFALVALWASLAPAAAVPTALEAFDRVRRAYDAVPGYQAEMEVTEYGGGTASGKRSFRYSFVKPRRFRIDMHEPHRGAVLFCCEADGRIVVRPGGLGSVLKLRLAPDSRFFQTGVGQRLDQTDLGLLIENMGHSVGEQRRGPASVTFRGGRLVLEAVAPDHFLPGVLTRYRFLIDPQTSLPAGVEERTPEGELKRTVRFEKLTVVRGFPDGFFDPDAKDAEKEDR